MKTFEIVLNNRFSATTQISNTGLTLLNDYLVYINRNGGGIVNAYNVRGYLNDSRNQQITADFFAFLTGSTTVDQTLNIVQSDKKLADVFNDYYQRVVISATQIASTAVIQQNLTGANQITAYDYLHPWIGYAPSKQLTGITQEIYGSVNSIQPRPYLEDFTTEESYYIPVYLERGTNQMTRYVYDVCDPKITPSTAGLYPQFSAISMSYFGSQSIANILSNINSADTVFATGSTSATTADTRIHTLLNCFVDLNLETNENVGGAEPLPKVSFQFSAYTIDEGDPLQVIVGLDTPSTAGIEQATIDLIPPSTNFANAGLDYTALQIYPVTFTWAIGEQFKTLTFSALTDFLLENIESYNLQISNIINCDPGTFINTSVSINDTTVLRTVSLGLLPPTPSSTIGQGLTTASVDEGNFVDLLVSLDNPAFGVESITLSLVNSASTIGGPVGPYPNPASSNDYVISGASIVFSFTPGEIQKTFRFSAKTDITIEQPEQAIFELSNPQFCLLNSAAKVVELTIQDTTGGYKYVHLNLGRIYSEFGDSQQNTLMRQINPQPSFSSNYNNIYANQYVHNLIEYGTTINWKDYNGSAAVNSDTYYLSTVRFKITNLGNIQSIVNGIPLNTGQTLNLSVSGSNFIVTATTNSNKNTTTNLYDFANYKMELVNYYSGKTIPLISSSYSQPVQYTMRNTGNTISTDKTINLGIWNLSGMTTNQANTLHQYRLKSKYKNVNTGRPNIGTYSSPVYTCPPVASFFYGISFSEFYAVDIENISILGIIFLNFNQYANYTNNIMSTYDTFEFAPGLTSTTTYYDCAQTSSEYNGLNYISLPFKVEP